MGAGAVVVAGGEPGPVEPGDVALADAGEVALGDAGGEDAGGEDPWAGAVGVGLAEDPGPDAGAETGVPVGVGVPVEPGVPVGAGLLLDELGVGHGQPVGVQPWTASIAAAIPATVACFVVRELQVQRNAFIMRPDRNQG